MFVSNLFIPALVIIVILLNIRQTYEIRIQKVTFLGKLECFGKTVQGE